ncbi:MAG: hypothetical protein KIT22_06895 [Verrucomicrobiae bacterium]|nr:hypothetical protein [Verrucomicrobiae bacterium]
MLVPPARSPSMMFTGSNLLFAVVVRELRAAARRRGTYWLRTVVMGAALLVLLVRIGTGRLAQLLASGAPGALPGGEVFAILHALLCVTLLLAAPVFAADCIARERREGTLGLLGLTPLRPAEIVIGKVAVQAIRLLSLWLACVPALGIPLLMGGVSGADFQYALGIEFMILVGGLAAGLVATSLCTRWVAAAGWAFSGTLLVGQCLTLFAAGLLRWVAFQQPPGTPTAGFPEVSTWWVSLFIWPLATGLLENSFAATFGSLPAWIRSTADLGLICGIGIVLACLWGAVAFAGTRVRRLLRVEPAAMPSKRARTGRRVSAPAEARRRRWLATNPARWLCEKEGSRMGRWIWLGLVVAGWLLTTNLRYIMSDLAAVALVFPLILSVPMALHAAASFRQELEEGTLELLLVTPLEPAKLVWARVRSLWALYLPAAIANAVCIAVLPMDGGDNPNLASAHWAGMFSLLTLPAIGIRYAVRRLHPLSGFLWALLTAGILPLLMGLASMASVWASVSGFDLGWTGPFFFLVGFGGTQIFLSATWGWLAAQDLETRAYMFRPFQRKAA